MKACANDNTFKRRHLVVIYSNLLDQVSIFNALRMRYSLIFSVWNEVGNVSKKIERGALILYSMMIRL